MRFELTTLTLARLCSTPELRPRPWVERDLVNLAPTRKRKKRRRPPRGGPPARAELRQARSAGHCIGLRIGKNEVERQVIPARRADAAPPGRQGAKARADPHRAFGQRVKLPVDPRQAVEEPFGSVGRASLAQPAQRAPEISKGEDHVLDQKTFDAVG